MVERDKKLSFIDWPSSRKKIGSCVRDFKVEGESFTVRGEFPVFYKPM